MTRSLFFYDLETSGINPRSARIMQFAGQRTDLKLKPIGEPVNLLVKLTDDIVPEPDAILITGITPQQSRAEGITEAEFLKIFSEEVAVPGTIFTGFNTVRFDDEFMRYLHYRNFYDPYEWQWQDDRSRWDLLDVVRLTRALRPDGIKWPFDSTGKPSNRLELLTGINGLEHTDAHDALSDVHATIAMARLIYNKQTKLFDYLLSMRSKKAVAELIDSAQPFVYATGKYSAEFEKTSVAVKIADHPTRQGALVFDLRHDPTNFIDKSAAELAELWRYKKDPLAPRLPVKTLQYNRCPAVAPLGVLDDSSQARLSLDVKTIQANLKKLSGATSFVNNLHQAVDILNQEQQTRLLANELDVDTQLYDDFFSKADQTIMRAVRAAQPSEIMEFQDRFKDSRLRALLPLYKARNFPKSLTPEEMVEWESYRQRALLHGGDQSRLAKFFKRLEELAKSPQTTAEQQYLLEELHLYGESIMPDPDFAG
ncbi:MAG: exodeoxyribonuclease [Patescibacteria group bacterium]|nr:exodeoxyribonuclease [Patescibacteria group bacterium]